MRFGFSFPMGGGTRGSLSFGKGGSLLFWILFIFFVFTIVAYARPNASCATIRDPALQALCRSQSDRTPVRCSSMSGDMQAFCRSQRRD